ncbi:hypothetical protein BN903_52 [Halorubrum sp. AJ67]|nr:hypothetical protein BN903_52 [Halorubrum sp. AJ67]
MCLASHVLVITSYSIHYTKLYESTRAGGRRDGTGGRAVPISTTAAMAAISVVRMAFIAIPDRVQTHLNAASRSAHFRPILPGLTERRRFNDRDRGSER